jgi:adenylate cyclase
MKLLGDGAILAGPHAPDVVSATAGLTGGTAAARGPAIPPVHAGIATGDVVLRRGEIYGATANLAARLCEVAEPGTMLADDATRAASAELDWQSAGECRPKGFGRDIEVYTLA